MDEILMTLGKTVLTAVVSALIGAVVAHVKTRARVKQEDIEAMQTRQKALEGGMCALLRGEMLRLHEHYAALGCAPLYVKEVFEKMYKAYHSLGGNGSMTSLWEEFRELPTKEGRYE